MAMATAAAAAISSCSFHDTSSMKATKLKQVHHPLAVPSLQTTKSVGSLRPSQALRVNGEYNGKKSSSGNFFAGVMIGGAVFGALGYIFAPQVNKFLFGAEDGEGGLAKKLSKHFSEEEGIERTRRRLNDKITELNSAIDKVSAQLRADNGIEIPDELPVEIDKVISQS